MTTIVDTRDVALYEAYDNRYARQEARFGVERRASEKAPIIGISPFVTEGTLADRKAVAADIRRACIDIGFFYVRGHGVCLSDLAELDRIGKAFFALPFEVKMKTHASRNAADRGYTASGGVEPDKTAATFSDIKERYMMSRELAPGEPASHKAGSSQWPDESNAPGFRGFMQRHIRDRLVLMNRLMSAFAMSLELPETFFEKQFARPGVTLALNYYPHVDPSRLDRTQWSFSPHTDYGGATLLTQDEVGGLQARNSAGDWIDIPPIENTFVVNLGDMFAMWTNDLYTSTLHRAMNTSGQARLSAAFFTGPDPDTMIRCLPGCHGTGNPPRYQPIRAGDYNDALVKQYRATGRPGISMGTGKKLAAN